MKKLLIMSFLLGAGTLFGMSESEEEVYPEYFGTGEYFSEDDNLSDADTLELNDLQDHGYTPVSVKNLDTVIESLSTMKNCRLKSERIESMNIGALIDDLCAMGEKEADKLLEKMQGHDELYSKVQGSVAQKKQEWKAAKPRKPAYSDIGQNTVKDPFSRPRSRSVGSLNPQKLKKIFGEDFDGDRANRNEKPVLRKLSRSNRTIKLRRKKSDDGSGLAKMFARSSGEKRKSPRFVKKAANSGITDGKDSISKDLSSKAALLFGASGGSPQLKTRKGHVLSPKMSELITNAKNNSSLSRTSGVSVVFPMNEDGTFKDRDLNDLLEEKIKKEEGSLLDDISKEKESDDSESGETIVIQKSPRDKRRQKKTGWVRTSPNTSPRKRDEDDVNF